MKTFQVVENICHYDATPIHPTLEDTVGKYAPNIIFIETPDYVFEGWGFDETQDGDARFIKPTPPDGWRYNDETGGFEEINPTIPEEEPQPVETKESLKAQIAELESQVEALEQENAELLFYTLTGEELISE